MAIIKLFATRLALCIFIYNAIFTIIAKSNSNPSQYTDIASQIIKHIPSPLEISFLLREQSNLYNKNSLNDYDKAKNYTTQYKKSLNLGIYGTNLGYSNVYGKTQDALNYLVAIKTLAEGLSIGQFFDYSTLKSLAERANNLDSLLLISQKNMDDISSHLRNQNRESLSALMITGGWIEATYLILLVYKYTKSELIRERIGDQKIVLEQILSIMSIYRDKPGFAGLFQDLEALNKVYQSVKIEVIYSEPTIKEVNNKIVVIDNSSSNIIMTDSDLINIDKEITRIRNKIIK